jgi:hypothetical protein
MEAALPPFGRGYEGNVFFCYSLMDAALETVCKGAYKSFVCIIERCRLPCRSADDSVFRSLARGFLEKLR